jgi:sugar phosphate isomerase/epimerase
MSLPVALQVYSVRDEMADDFTGTLEKIKEMDYDGIEWGGVNIWDFAEVRKIIDGIGIRSVSAHVPYEVIMGDIEKVLADYKSLGCDYIAIPWLSPDKAPGGKDFDKTIEDIKQIGKIGNDLGIKLLYHNHEFEFVKVDGKYGLDVLYESVSEDLLATQVDTCWVKVAKVDPAQYVRKYKGRAPVIHLKDFIIEGEVKGDLYGLVGKDEDAPISRAGFDFRPLGQGFQDIPSILDAGLYVGAEWVVVEQDASSTCTPLEAAKQSREYLKSLGW